MDRSSRWFRRGTYADTRAMTDIRDFYLYVRKYLEEKHNLAYERADDRVTTLPLSEKVRSTIQKADVVIADCTGRNSNVMYELGLAHAFERKLVLLTCLLPTPLKLFPQI